MECDLCGEETGVMPFRCKFCGGRFCVEHRLPENHNCAGLEEYRKTKPAKSGLTYEPFKSKNIKPVKPPRRGIFDGIIKEGNYYLYIILFTTAIFFLQIIPGFTETFWLDPRIDVLLLRPWTLLTSIFLHGGVYHIFVNMLVLYFFGPELERRIGSRDFLMLYLLGGVLSGVGYVIFANLTGSMAPAIGASGAIFAMFAALAMIAPEIRVLIFFIIPMRIRDVLVVFALWDLILLPLSATGHSMIASSAHLTGILVGLLFGRRFGKRRKHILFEWAWY